MAGTHPKTTKIRPATIKNRGVMPPTPTSQLVKLRVNPLLEQIKKNKIPINYQNEDGKTALHLALIRKRVSEAKYLFKHGVDDTITDKRGKTAYSYYFNSKKPVDLSVSKMFEQVCNQGRPLACQAYALQLPGNKNDRKYHVNVLKYLKKACDQGVGSSCSKILIGYTKIPSLQLAHSPHKHYLLTNEAIAVAKKGCSLTNKPSCEALGDFYINKKNKNYDLELAGKYYKLGCTEMNEHTCDALARYYVETDDLKNAYKVYNSLCVQRDKFYCATAKKYEQLLKEK